MKRFIILLVALTTLGGCVSPRDRIGESVQPDWLERRDYLRSLDDWRMEGRLALRTGRDGYNGTLSWEQLDDDLDFRFRGPFGFGGFRIHGDLEQLRVKTSGGDEFYLRDPEVEMRERFGWSVPVHSMRYWIVGVSDPAVAGDEVVDEDGYLLELEQGGWQVSYDGYRDYEGLDLPRKVVMVNGDVQIKVVADKWRLEFPDQDEDLL
ncbi:MAG: lipoprotein insertase outer membrane protein LolB [Gammaproteobacteria bacterium]